MAAGPDPGSIRASDSDRSHTQSLLNDAYAEGRITRDEWEERATALGGPVTHADLARLTRDLVPQPPPAAPPAQYPVQTWAQPPTNGMAIASFVCGLGQLIGGPIAGVAAVVLGHQARRRIRLTGERGDGLATTGLVLGYVGVGLVLLAILAFLLLGIASIHGDQAG